MNDLNIGLATRCLGGMSLADAAGFMRKVGFTSCELCMSHSDFGGWVYNGITPLADKPKEAFLRAADVFRENGIEVVSLGVFTDLRSSDDGERRRHIDFFREIAESAAYAGIPILATECGFTPEERGYNHKFAERDFANLKSSLGELTSYADSLGLKLALEACVIDIVPSPKRLRDLIQQIEEEYSSRLGVLLDAANFIANADEDDMFKYLADNTLYHHGKGRFVNDATGREFGIGDIDWYRYFELYRKLTPNTPFILEYANADNCARLRELAISYANGK